MPWVNVASSSKPSTNSPMMRNTRQGSVCVNSSGRGLSRSCSSCVVLVFGRFKGLVVSSSPIFFAILDPHYVVATVDVDHFAGDPRRHRAAKEDGSVSDLACLYVATERRAFGVVLQHRAEVGDAASGKCLNRSSADGIDADIAWTEV